MSMSKQDFVALADAIREHNQYENKPKFTEDHLNTLILFCRGQNNRFMSGRWKDYIAGECGPNGRAIKPQK